MDRTTRTLMIALGALLLAALIFSALMGGMRGPGFISSGQTSQGTFGPGMIRGHGWMWGLGIALRTFAPSTMVRMVAAVPNGFAMTSEDVRFVTEGFIFDAFISNADVHHYDLDGQQKKGRDELADFFAETRDRCAERVAS